MRLLNTKTGKFVLVDHPRTVHYAILSHVWSRQDSPDYVPEQTYQDVCRIIDEHSDPVNPSLAGEPPSSAGHYVSGSVESIPSSTTGDSILPYLSDKIRCFCEVASADGFDLAWVDTCCIDKTNPAELDEAIASMYDWYSYAKACYVFLSDVSNHATPPGSRVRGHWETEFRQSQWFFRGWTLQELLAPNVVIFFSKDWQVLGSKHTLASLVEDITSIEATIIKCRKSLNEVSVARRMAWAAPRKTAREEDRAYSLLGIFGVKIRIVYGEGSYSFYRLQEAIIEEIPDQTIFAWQLCLPQRNLLPDTFSRPSDTRRCSPTPSTPLSSTGAATTKPKQLPKPPVDAVYDSWQYLLANSPDDFANSSDLTPLSREELVETLPGILPVDAIQTFKPTVHGISARLPLVQFTTASGASDSASYLALLACKFGESSKALVALLLRPHDDVPSVQASQYIVGTTLSEVPPTPSSRLLSPALLAPYVRATVLTPEQAAKFRDTFVHVNIFIASRPSRVQHRLERDLPFYRDIQVTRDTFRIMTCGWSSRLLTQQGYTMSFPPIHGLVMLNPGNLLEDIAARFVITRRGVAAGGPSLDVQIGRLCANDAQGLGVAVICGSDMHLADGYSDFTRKYHSHISSWTCQGGAATKELDLVSLRGTELTLRLVFTHESSDDSPRGTTGSTSSSYRLGAEIFDIREETESHQLEDPASHHGRNAYHAPQLTRGNNQQHIPSFPMPSLIRRMSGPRR